MFFIINKTQHITVHKGVTTLDGAQGKKQVWRPMFEPEVFRKEITVLKKLRLKLLRLFGAPIMTRRRGNFATRRYAPDCASLVHLVTAKYTGCP